MLTRINHCVRQGMGKGLNLRQIAAWFIAAVCGGVIGAVAALVMVGWLGGRPSIFGADWWNAFTALGTVGTVLISLAYPLVGYIGRQKKLKNENLISAVYLSNHIYRNFYSLAEIGERLFSILRQSYGKDLCKLFEDDLRRVEAELQERRQRDYPGEGGRLIDEMLQRHKELLTFLEKLDDPKSTVRVSGDVLPYIEDLFSSLIWQGERIVSYRRELSGQLARCGIEQDLMWPKVRPGYDENVLGGLKSCLKN